MFQTKNNSGEAIRKEDNEKSFVITPLLSTNPVKVKTNLNEILKNNGHLEDALADLTLDDGPTASAGYEGRYTNSLDESSC